MQANVSEPQTPKNRGFSSSNPLGEQKGEALGNIFVQIIFFLRPIGP